MSCPACGGRLAPWIEVPSGEPRDSRRFCLRRCAACGTAVTGGEPPGPRAYSEGVYDPRPPRASSALRALGRLTVTQPARALERAGLRPGARVLDAGAGRGRLVAELRRRGYDASGLDPRAGGATIETHSAAGLDAVVLWHTLEHLGDPLVALERVRGWLAPGGLVLVGVPNAASLQAQIAGPAWMHWDAPRHRTHFTADGLRRMTERGGLRVRGVQHMVWEHNPWSMWMALLSRAGMSPAFPFHALKRSAPLRPADVALSVLGLPLLAPASVLEALAASRGRGGTIALVAQA